MLEKKMQPKMKAVTPELTRKRYIEDPFVNVMVICPCCKHDHWFMVACKDSEVVVKCHYADFGDETKKYKIKY